MEKIKVFFNEEMVVNKEFSSPSPKKPGLLIKEWNRKYEQIEVVNFNKLIIEDFYLAHEKVFVDGVFNLQIMNGMNTFDSDLNKSLYWTSGSLFAAAKESIESGIAISPTSGFHHSGYSSCWGFCTFNGLLITSIKLLNEKLVKKIGILDFDYHQGDGSENIIEKLNLQKQIVHITGGTNYNRSAEMFFKELPKLLESLKKVDIIIYQAGADQHIDDPLGGFLNSNQLRNRDKLVLQFAKENNIPIVWNLAGGYQEEIINGESSIQKVLDIHNATLEETIKIWCK